MTQELFTGRRRNNDGLALSVFRRPVLITSTPLALLILGIGLYLSLQHLLSSLLGDHTLLMAWIVLPILLFVLLVPQLVIDFHRSKVSFLLLLFLFVQSFHVVAQGALYGAIGSGWAMASYSLWLGLFSWVQLTNFKTVLWLGESVFLGSALIHAAAILLDYYFFHGLFKIVTIGEVTRNYGISSSIAIGSLQLAVGMLLAISLFFRARSKSAAIFFLSIFCVLIIALFLASVRGPIIYSFLVLTFFWAARFSRGVSTGTLFTLSIIGVLGGVAVFAYVISYDYMSWHTSLNYIQDAFSFTDSGNEGRLEQYRISMQLLARDWWIPFVGYGAAELTQLPTAFDEVEFTSESSLLKALLELGIIGLLPITVLLGIVLTGLVNTWRHPLIKYHIVFFAVLFLLLAQCMTHETFKTWIGSFYFVLSLGICVRLLVEAGHLKRPVRLVFLPKKREFE